MIIFSARIGSVMFSIAPDYAHGNFHIKQLKHRGRHKAIDIIGVYDILDLEKSEL